MPDMIEADLRSASFRAITGAREALLELTDAGRSVIICEANPAKASCLFLASLAAGCRPLIIPQATKEEISRLADASGAEVVLASTPCGSAEVLTSIIDVALMDAIAPGKILELIPKDAMALVTTSGSSGRPKIIAHYARSIFANAVAHCRSVDAHPQSKFLTFLPMHYSFQCLTLLSSALTLDGEVHFVGSIEPRAISKRLLALAPDFINFTPYMLSAFMRTEFARDLTHAKCVTVGGSAVGIRQVETLRSLVGQGLRCYVTYGMTECGPRISTYSVHSNSHIEGPLGKPLEGVSLRLDEEGRVEIKTDYLAAGYMSDARVIPLIANSNEYYRSNDLAVEGNECLEYAGRSDNLIVLKDQKIQPEEIENLILSSFSEISHCLVVKERGTQGDHLVCRVFTHQALAGDSLLSDVRQFLNTTVHRAKRPTKVEIRQVEFSAVGKMKRRESTL